MTQEEAKLEFEAQFGTQYLESLYARDPQLGETLWLGWLHGFNSAVWKAIDKCEQAQESATIHYGVAESVGANISKHRIANLEIK